MEFLVNPLGFNSAPNLKGFKLGYCLHETIQNSQQLSQQLIELAYQCKLWTIHWIHGNILDGTKEYSQYIMASNSFVGLNAHPK